MTVVDKIKAASDMECTNWPEGDWHDCCVAHDYDYAEGNGKWKSDFKLAKCVAKKGKYRPSHLVVGALMWFGVTFGGWKPYNEYKELRNGPSNQGVQL